MGIIISEREPHGRLIWQRGMSRSACDDVRSHDEGNGDRRQAGGKRTAQLMISSEVMHWLSIPASHPRPDTIASLWKFFLTSLLNIHSLPARAYGAEHRHQAPSVAVLLIRTDSEYRAHSSLLRHIR